MLYDWSQCDPFTKALKNQLGIHTVSYLGGQMHVDSSAAGNPQGKIPD